MEGYYWVVGGCAVVGVAFQTAGVVVGLTWRFSLMDRDLRKYIAVQNSKLRDEIEAQNRALVSDLNSVRLETGEVASALRTKINEVELYFRDRLDNYVRRDSFSAVIAEVKTLVTDTVARMDKRFDKVEEKLDRRSG